jgi:hypothetical protein
MTGPSTKTAPTTRRADAALAAHHEADAVVAEARALERETEAMQERSRQAIAENTATPALADLLSAVQLVAELCQALLRAPSTAPVVEEVYEATKDLPEKLRAALEQRPG